MLRSPAHRISGMAHSRRNPRPFYFRPAECRWRSSFPQQIEEPTSETAPGRARCPAAEVHVALRSGRVGVTPFNLAIETASFASIRTAQTERPPPPIRAGLARPERRIEIGFGLHLN